MNKSIHFTPDLKDKVLESAQAYRRALQESITGGTRSGFAWARSKDAEELSIVKTALNKYYVHGDMSALLAITKIEGTTVTIDLT